MASALCCRRITLHIRRLAFRCVHNALSGSRLSSCVSTFQYTNRQSHNQRSPRCARMKTIVAAAILSWQVAAASAATVASTFGPSDSYATSSAAIIGVTDGHALQQALPFTLPGSSSYSLDGIEVPVSASSPQFTTMVFDLMADSAGIPGPVLESFTFSGITTAFSGEIVSGQSSLRPTLLAGETYWLSASAPQSTLYWNLALGGPNVPRALRRDSGAWEIFDGDDPSTAFRISGTVVPEPAAWSLIIVGTSVIALLRARARKRGANG